MNRHQKRYGVESVSIFSVFQINPSGTEGALSASVRTAFPDDHYEIAPGYWLVSSATSAKQVSDAVGISEGTHGTGIVIEVGSYFGRANPAIWSWIKVKWEAGRVG
jgi:hypothetical protein